MSKQTNDEIIRNIAELAGKIGGDIQISRTPDAVNYENAIREGLADAVAHIVGNKPEQLLDWFCIHLLNHRDMKAGDPTAVELLDDLHRKWDSWQDELIRKLRANRKRRESGESHDEAE